MYKLSKIIIGIVLGLAAFSTIIALWHTVMPESMRWMPIEDVSAMAGIATMLDIMVIVGAVSYFIMNNNPDKKRRYYDW